MKAVIKSKSGQDKGQIEFPSQFNEPIRPDLIKRAFLVIQSNKRQPYGADPDAGHKFSSKLSRRRRDYRGAYGMGISRVPRKIMTKRGTRFNWMGATAPNTVGGMQPHPPKAERIWSRKINKKERRKAIRSALAATIDKELVAKRGHKFTEYPLVFETEVESVGKTKEAILFLEKIGLKDELVRSARKTQKTGIARRRGRIYKKAKGPLVVVSKNCPLMDSAKNIPGVDVIIVTNLNAENLAPGTDCGRLTLYSKDSIDLIKEKRLFTDNPVIDKPVLKKEKKVTKKKTKKPSKTKKVETKKSTVETKKPDVKKVTKDKPVKKVVKE